MTSKQLGDRIEKRGFISSSFPYICNKYLTKMKKLNFTARFKIGEKLKWTEILQLTKRIKVITGQNPNTPIKKLGNTFYYIDGEIFTCDLGEEPDGLLDCNYYLTKYGNFKNLEESNMIREELIQSLAYMNSSTDEGQIFFNGISLKTRINKLTSTDLRATQEQVALAVVQKLCKRIELSIGEVKLVKEPRFNLKTLNWDSKPVKIMVLEEPIGQHIVICKQCCFNNTSLCNKTYECVGQFREDNTDIYFKLIENESI